MKKVTRQPWHTEAKAHWPLDHMALHIAHSTPRISSNNVAMMRVCWSTRNDTVIRKNVIIPEVTTHLMYINDHKPSHWVMLPENHWMLLCAGQRSTIYMTIMRKNPSESMKGENRTNIPIIHRNSLLLPWKLIKVASTLSFDIRYQIHGAGPSTPTLFWIGQVHGAPEVPFRESEHS